MSNEPKLILDGKRVDAWDPRCEPDHGVVLDYLVSPDALFSRRVEYRIDKGPPKTSGVYFLYDEDVVVYVGQSVEMASRLWKHMTSHWRPWSHYSFIEVPRPHPDEIDSFLDKVETFYIHHLQPEANLSIPPLPQYIKHLLRQAASGALWEGAGDS